MIREWAWARARARALSVTGIQQRERGTDVFVESLQSCMAYRREIMAMQDGLRALLARVNTVKEDCKKAEADNEMLQTYIDSVTKSLAAKERG